MTIFMSADYYKNYNRFRSQSNYSTDIKNDKPNGDYGQPDSDYSKFSNEYSSERTIRSLDYYMQPPPRRVVNTKCINMSTNKKRDINDKLKEY